MARKNATPEHDEETGEVIPEGVPEDSQDDLDHIPDEGWDEAFGGFVEKRISVGDKGEQAEIHLNIGDSVRGEWIGTIQPDGFKQPQAVIKIKGEDYLFNVNFDADSRLVSAGMRNDNGWPVPAPGVRTFLNITFIGTKPVKGKRGHTMNEFRVQYRKEE